MGDFYEMNAEMEDSNKLANQKIPKLLFNMAVPGILAQVINLLYNMIDRMFIGRIPDVGALALTGVGVTFPIVILIAAFAALVSMGAAPRASIALGKEDKKEAEKILGNSTSALIFVSVVITAIILVFGEDILRIFGASSETIVYGLQYIRIYAFGTIFVQLALGLNAFITAQGFAKTSMITISIGAVLNLILDPILIFGLNMGVRGAATATVISQGASAIFVVWFLLGKKTNLKIKVKNLPFERKIIVPSLVLGLSPFIMQFTESILAVVFNSSLQEYGGDLAVGTMTILTSVMQFSMMPLIGLTQGSQPIISYNFGARNMGRVKESFKLLLLTALTYSTLLWLAIMVRPDLFAKIFTNDPALIEMVIPSIRIFMSMSFLFSVQIACQQTFIALGNAKVSVFLALLRKVILLIPLILILPRIFSGDPVNAIFFAEPISDTISVIVTSILAYISFKEIFNGEQKSLALSE
ncbi:MAG: MATE family efflux transporter [Atopostipes suicloacalis]|nr:MATE family efflux transporter [Atopostipes suicloacalis]